MWAILKAVSRPPSSVEFHHVARRPQRLERSVLPGASRTEITCSHSLSVRFSSASFSPAVRGYSNGKNCPTVVWELSPPGSAAAGVPEALPDGKVYPGLDVKLGNTLTGECETVSSPAFGSSSLWANSSDLSLFYHSMVPRDEKQKDD